MARPGGTLAFSLAKGSAVIVVGSTLPMMTGSATVESLPQPHLTHQVIVFTVKEEEKDDGGYDIAQYEVPFRLVLPVPRSLSRPARRPPAARFGH
jgi:hypothetical protein